MAFGWPRADGGTLIFDQASAAMARGEIMIAAREGHTVPLGTGIDKAGNQTTDPKEILQGAQLPFGGYKGSSLAMMVELLAAGLIGQPFSFEAGEEDNRDGGPPRGGVLLLAMDPQKFGDAEGWLQHSESFLQRLSGLDDVRLPGARRAANRARIAREGATLPAKAVDRRDQCRLKRAAEQLLRRSSGRPCRAIYLCGAVQVGAADGVAARIGHTRRMVMRIVLYACLIALANAQSGTAADNFPTKPVRIVVGFTPALRRTSRRALSRRR
jgi:hypothetical protein